MTSKKREVSDHFRPEKVHRRSAKREEKLLSHSSSSSPGATVSSFPHEFLQSFSFKAEHDEVSAQGARQSSRNIQQTIPSTSYLVEDDNTRPPSKKKRIKAEESDEYLPGIPDYVRDDMDILIIGSNPGRMSSRKGQHFSHPSNHFYKALHQSGLTPIQVSPSQDFTLLDQVHPSLSIGLTNLVARPTRMAQDLNKAEEVVGTEITIDLVRQYRPKLGLFVGIGVARSFERSLAQIKSLQSSAAIKKEEEEEVITICVAKEIPLVTDKNLGLGVGLMNEAIRHPTGDGYTLLYSMPSTSGRVTTHQLKEKAECMKWARVLTSQLGTDPYGDKQDVSLRLI